MRDLVVRARAALVVGALAATAALAPVAAGAAPAPSPVACTIAGSTVTATGLPTDQVINFLVKDASGTGGWVVGYTATGSLTVTAPPPRGPTTYLFTSRTWGPNGSKYTVFASCATS